MSHALLRQPGRDRYAEAGKGTCVYVRDDLSGLPAEVLRVCMRRRGSALRVARACSHNAFRIRHDRSQLKLFSLDGAAYLLCVLYIYIFISIFICIYLLYRRSSISAASPQCLTGRFTMVRRARSTMVRYTSRRQPRPSICPPWRRLLAETLYFPRGTASGVLGGGLGAGMLGHAGLAAGMPGLGHLGG